MTIYFFAWFVMDWLRTGVFPATTFNELGRLPESWIAPLMVGLGGMFLFGCSFAWALVTSLVIRNRLKRTDSDR